MFILKIQVYKFVYYFVTGKSNKYKQAAYDRPRKQQIRRRRRRKKSKKRCQMSI